MYNENLENLTVVKRSGQRVEFNASKVALAIKKAFDSIEASNTDGAFKTFEKVLEYINENYKDRKTINVEEIQDIIEQKLNELNYVDVFNSFKEYRNKRTLSRKVFPEKQQHKFLKAIEKFEKNDFNNSNKKGPYDLLKKFGIIIFNEYTKTYVLDTKSVRAYEEGNIYIHNLDYFALGVLGNTHLDFEIRLNNNEYGIFELINEIIASSKELSGEIGINNIDFIFKSLYIKKFQSKVKFLYKKYFSLFGLYDYLNTKRIDDLIEKETDILLDIQKYENYLVNEQTKQIFENSYIDAEEQTKESIKRDLLKMFETLNNTIDAKKSYIISFGNEISNLGKIINEDIQEILSNREFINLNFVIKIKEQIPNLDLIIKTQNHIFIENSEDEELEFFKDGTKIYENINNNLNTSRGRSVVTNTSINLARLGLKYQNKDRNEFFKELSNISDLVKNQMCLAFETIGDKTKENYKTLFTGNLFDDEKLEEGQKIRKVIKNGIQNIGLIGLKECAILLEKEPKNQLKLIHEILDFMNEKCEVFKTDTKLNFGIHETTDVKARCHLLKIDKAIYGNVSSITDKDAYDVLDDTFCTTNDLIEIQKKFSYGKLITLKINKQEAETAIKQIQNENIEFAELRFE